MTSRERMLAAYQRRQPDRVPINVRGVGVLDKQWVADRHPSFRPLIELVEQHGDLIMGYSPKGKGNTLIPWHMVEKVENRTHDMPRWTLHERIVHTPKGPISYVTQVSKEEFSSLTREFWIVDDDADLERYLSLPYSPPEADTSDFAAYEEEVGERAVILIGGIDPIAHVHDLLGSEKLALWSFERRRDVDMLIEMFTERMLDWIGRVLATGIRCTFAYVGAEYCLPPLMPPSDFKPWVVEPMKRISKLIHDSGSLVHVHSHGPLDSVLEGFAEMGADVLHPIEAPPMGDVTLAEAKRRIGKDVCLEGNIQIGDIYTAEEFEIRDQVKRAIDEAAPGGGFILCPTASPYTPVLPEKAVRNYRAFVETALEYGRY